MSKELSFIRSYTSYGLHGIFCKIRTLRLAHFMYWYSFCWEKTQRRTMQLIWNKIEHWSYFLLMNKLIFFFSPFCFIAKCFIISCCNVDIIINNKKSLCLEFRLLCVDCLNQWCAAGIEIQTQGLYLPVLNYSVENSVWKIKKSAKPTKIFLLMLNKEGDCWNQIFKACTSFGRVKCMVKNPELG